MTDETPDNAAAIIIIITRPRINGPVEEAQYGPFDFDGAIACLNEQKGIKG